MVSDAGGFDDKSFNQLGFEGLTERRRRARRRADRPSSPTARPTTRRTSTASSTQGCNLIVTVGFALSAATVEAAQANPDIDFAIDRRRRRQRLRRHDRRAEHQADPLRHRPGRVPRRLRRGELLEDRHRRHLRRHELPDRHDLHGRLRSRASSTTTTEKGTAVKVVGWDRRPDGALHRWLRGQRHRAQDAAQSLIDQGADVLLPVGGPIYQSAARPSRTPARTIALLGVDADVFETDPTSPTSPSRRSSRASTSAVDGRRARRAATATSTPPRTSERSRTTESASRRSTTSRPRSPPTLQGELDDHQGRDHLGRRSRSRRTSPAEPQHDSRGGRLAGLPVACPPRLRSRDI